MKRAMNTQIVNEAAAWAVSVDAGSLNYAQRVELADWLNASPVHIEEFLIASAMLCGVSQADSIERVDLADLMSPGSAEIVDLPVSESASPRAESDVPRQTIPVRGVLMALAAVIAFGLIFMAAIGLSGDGDVDYVAHSTGLGEHRTLRLEDGSLIHLNTQSEIRVSFTDTERRVELVGGEALFDIESDPARPFKVTAGDTVAEALGTVFNVRLIQDEAIVSVVEGKVRVDQVAALAATGRRSDTSGASQGIAPEPVPEPIVLTGGKTASTKANDQDFDLGEEEIDTITSWRDRKIVFERRPLTWIVGEFNRYNRAKLVVADDQLGQQLFSGTFDADDPDSFVLFLEQHHHMRALQVGRDTHIRPQR